VRLSGLGRKRFAERQRRARREASDATCGLVAARRDVCRMVRGSRVEAGGGARVLHGKLLPDVKIAWRNVWSAHLQRTLRSPAEQSRGSSVELLYAVFELLPIHSPENVAPT
jgi:hypothetical protein